MSLSVGVNKPHSFDLPRKVSNRRHSEISSITRLHTHPCLVISHRRIESQSSRTEVRGIHPEFGTRDRRQKKYQAEVSVAPKVHFSKKRVSFNNFYYFKTSCYADSRKLWINVEQDRSKFIISTLQHVTKVEVNHDTYPKSKATCFLVFHVLCGHLNSNLKNVSA